ncbi:MAG: AAA family ATPase [Actinobacteria bacterium]|nr:AAA family ATPase [Actinomycetota bacterium]
MHVRSLRVAGFKSFGDPVVFEWKPGANAIIGPNGSGKSNIADAVAWVLGSQAPSSLRSGSMEDVIFAGSQRRERLGVAEVELTLEGSFGDMPLDLAEITISRSTDRTGMSGYRINGVPCRLLDVAELLSDTGIGRNLHTVVGQGQLDVILQARPEDRRTLIEEAAQIGKFRRRKERSVRKIERVDDNLMRLGDVMSELKRAIRPLKRQALAAAQYSELMEEHRTLRQRLSAAELAELAEAEARWDPAGEERRAGLLREELEHVRAALGRVAGERVELDRQAQRQLALATGIVRAADRLAGTGRLALERVQRIAAQLEAETEERYQERIRLLEGERERWDQAAADEVRAATEAHRVAVAQEERAATAIRTSERAEAALAETRSAETLAAQELVRAEGAEAAGRTSLSALDAQARAALERGEVAEGALHTAARAVGEAETEVAALGMDLSSGVAAAAEAESRHEEERDRAESLRQRLGVSRIELAAAEARAATLEEVAGLFRGRDDVLTRLGPLMADAGEAVRLASASEDDAAGIVAGVEAAIEDRWVEVARCDGALRHLKTRMSGATERLEGARRDTAMRETELAALNEELARARTALAATERAATEDRAALPARRAVLEQAGFERAGAEAAAEAARLETAVERTAATQTGLDARSAEERVLAAQLRLEEALAGIGDAQTALAGLEEHRSVLSSARRRAEDVARIAGLASTIARRWGEGSDARAGATRAEAAERDARAGSMRDRQAELEQRLEAVNRARGEAEVRQAEARARIDGLCARAMEDWGYTRSDLGAMEPFPEGEQAGANERVAALERRMRSLGGINPMAQEEFTELDERAGFLQEQMGDLRASRRDLMAIVREVDATIVTEFSSAFADVAHEFEGVFERLFPGGRARMTLADPDDPLASGIEIEARPAGKRVNKLSLLSGGERSLVALAFLFSIFRARPSPFYLLDEVEAALDDVNLSRFLGLVADLKEGAQVLIVTHQKRTMEAADVLYGVSMGPEGVSRVVAKRLEQRVAGQGAAG